MLRCSGPSRTVGHHRWSEAHLGSRGRRAPADRSTLHSRVLCERHNNALSPLDALADQMFRAWRDDQVAQATDGSPQHDQDRFTLTDGPTLQLWMLKLFWGALAAASLGRDGTALTGLRPGVDVEQLAAILWRGGPRPSHQLAEIQHGASQISLSLRGNPDPSRLDHHQPPS